MFYSTKDTRYLPTANRRYSLAFVQVIVLTALGTTLSYSGGNTSYRHAAPEYELTNTFDAGGRPHFPGVNRKTQRLFVSDVPAGTVTMFDALSGTKLAVTSTGSQAHTVTVDEDNNLVYVANRGSNTVSVLNGDTNAVISTIPVGTGPHGLDVDTEHHRIFTSNTYSNDISVIDSSTSKLIRTIPVGIEPWGIVYDEVDNMLYVANTGEGTVFKVNPDNGKILKRFNVGGRPWNIKVSHEFDRIRIYVTNETLGILSVIDGKRVIAEVPIGIAGRGLVLDEEAGLAFAVATGSNQMTTVNLRTNQVVQNIAVGAGPTAVTLDKSSNTLYIANQGGGTISVITQK